MTARVPSVVPEYIDVKALSTDSMESTESQSSSSSCLLDKARGTCTHSHMMISHNTCMHGHTTVITDAALFNLLNI